MFELEAVGPRKKETGNQRKKKKGENYGYLHKSEMGMTKSNVRMDDCHWELWKHLFLTWRIAV